MSSVVIKSVDRGAISRAVDVYVDRLRAEHPEVDLTLTLTCIPYQGYEAKYKSAFDAGKGRLFAFSPAESNLLRNIGKIIYHIGITLAEINYWRQQPFSKIKNMADYERGCLNQWAGISSLQLCTASGHWPIIQPPALIKDKRKINF